MPFSKRKTTAKLGRAAAGLEGAVQEVSIHSRDDKNLEML